MDKNSTWLIIVGIMFGAICLAIGIYIGRQTVFHDIIIQDDSNINRAIAIERSLDESTNRNTGQ